MHWDFISSNRNNFIHTKSCWFIENNASLKSFFDLMTYGVFFRAVCWPVLTIHAESDYL